MGRTHLCFDVKVLQSSEEGAMMAETETPGLSGTKEECSSGGERSVVRSAQGSRTPRE